MVKPAPASDLGLFLSCDWGTTSFRLHLVRTETREILATTTEGQGVLATFEAWVAAGRDPAGRFAFYLGVIRTGVAQLERRTGRALAGVPLIASGMASASTGMVMLPYQPLPLAIDASNLGVKLVPATADFPHPLLIVSGACTDDDVMRGEETLLVGALAGRPAGPELVVVQPGTHSKHIRVQGGRAVGFATYMTGEFFALLSQRSILAQSVDSSARLTDAADRAGFLGGVRDGARGDLLHECFTLRSRDLLTQASKTANFLRLSGLLIGAELRPLLARPPAEVVLVCGPELTPLYRLAFEELAATMPLTLCAADDALLRGQAAVARQAHLL